MKKLKKYFLSPMTLSAISLNKTTLTQPMEIHTSREIKFLLPILFHKKKSSATCQLHLNQLLPEILHPQEEFSSKTTKQYISIVMKKMKKFIIVLIFIANNQLYAQHKDSSIVLATYDYQEIDVSLKKFDYLWLISGNLCHDCWKKERRSKILLIALDNDGDRVVRLHTRNLRQQQMHKSKLYFPISKEQKEYLLKKYGENILQKIKK